MRKMRKCARAGCAVPVREGSLCAGCQQMLLEAAQVNEATVRDQQAWSRKVEGDRYRLANSVRHLLNRLGTAAVGTDVEPEVQHLRETLERVYPPAPCSICRGRHGTELVHAAE